MEQQVEQRKSSVGIVLHWQQRLRMPVHLGTNLRERTVHRHHAESRGRRGVVLRALRRPLPDLGADRRTDRESVRVAHKVTY